MTDALGTASRSSSRKITIVGSLNTDLITRTSRLPSAGETLSAQSFATGRGGKGGNQAVACARLSRGQNTQVSMVGGVGDDAFGHETLQCLKQENINIDLVRVIPKESTGIAVILVDETSGENRILVAANANARVVPLSDPWWISPGAIPDLVLLQLEIPLDTVVRVLQEAKAAGVVTILNPAPAVKLGSEILKLVDHLVLNETEAVLVSGDEAVAQHDHDDWTSLGALGVRNVCITYGGRGVRYLCFRVDGGIEVNSFQTAEQVVVRDTTAAGDTFVGAYAVGLTSGGTGICRPDEVVQIVRWANACAAVTVTREGAQAAIPFRDEVVALNIH